MFLLTSPLQREIISIIYRQASVTYDITLQSITSRQGVILRCDVHCYNVVPYHWKKLDSVILAYCVSVWLTQLQYAWDCEVKPANVKIPEEFKIPPFRTGCHSTNLLNKNTYTTVHTVCTYEPEGNWKFHTTNVPCTVHCVVLIFTCPYLYLSNLPFSLLVFPVQFIFL